MNVNISGTSSLRQLLQQRRTRLLQWSLLLIPIAGFTALLGMAALPNASNANLITLSCAIVLFLIFAAILRFKPKFMDGISIAAAHIFAAIVLQRIWVVYTGSIFSDPNYSLVNSVWLWPPILFLFVQMLLPPRKAIRLNLVVYALLLGFILWRTWPMFFELPLRKGLYDLWVILLVGYPLMLFAAYSIGGYRLLAQLGANVERQKERETVLGRDLRRVKERLELAMQGSQDGYWDWTDLPDGDMWWSDEFYRLLGYERRHLRPSVASLQGLVSPEAASASNAGLNKAFEALLVTGETLDQQVQLITRNGQPCWYSVRAVAKMYRGKVVRVSGSLRDIDASYKAQLELEQKSQQLADANSGLERFAAAASHDLKEPVRGISMLNSLLLRKLHKIEISDASETKAEEVAEVAQAIERKSQQMIGAIDALLNVARLDHAAFVPQRCDLTSLLNEAIDRLNRLGQERELRIQRGDLPVLKGDRELLVQLLQNLLHNAIKYQPQDPVQIWVTATEHSDSWELQVRDTGIGFEPVYAQRIFEAFARLHGREQYQGTGLGLAAVKRIADIHGGTVRAESQLGIGSSFYVRLPKQQLEEAFPKC